jgi:hypothetical protein
MESTTTASAEAVAVCQQVVDTYRAIACAGDSRISQCNQPVYQRSRQLFIAAVQLAFGVGRTRAWRIYDVWVGCMEPIDYCARYVAEHPRDRVCAR